MRYGAAATANEMAAISACVASGPSGGGEDLAEPGREGIRFARLPVLAAEESGVIAREDRHLSAKAFGDRVRAAVRHLTL